MECKYRCSQNPNKIEESQMDSREQRPGIHTSTATSNRFHSHPPCSNPLASKIDVQNHRFTVQQHDYCLTHLVDPIFVVEEADVESLEDDHQSLRKAPMHNPPQRSPGCVGITYRSKRCSAAVICSDLEKSPGAGGIDRNSMSFSA